ncbi:MAG: CBS domain-containing protein [Clostridium sulfidigenes]|uniref:CBS domain-containing protein n=1 Tax=Clostridium sulfidigenes TaxID=318464 RepID=A0A927ZIL1_9CLOT|nr:CBS domain-containing protein [Clostridium sulfidigenes]
MNIQDIIINEEINIRQAAKVLDKTAKQVLLITEDNKLKAVLTDGDIRRWILKSGDLSAPVKEIANYSPKYITETERYKAKRLMKKYSISSIPVVSIEGEVKSIIFWNDLDMSSVEKKPSLDIPVVIMAGGLGTRLYPYTKILPKPLIPIGDIPIVERIINRFKGFGCNEYYLTVNYKKNMIKAYFEEVVKNYNIYYIEEDKPLGTGGSLYYLKDKIKSTFFVSNCDILIDSDYEAMYDYHKENKNFITMVCAVKNMVIPYGVVNLNKEGNIQNMVEKPEYSFLTNTGMYIIEPEALQLIKKDTFIHLPDIAKECMDKGMKVGVYPITERAWMDMGQPDEMQEMMKRLEEG